MNKVMNMITDQTYFIFTVSEKSSMNMKQIFDNDKAIQTKSFVIVKLWMGFLEKELLKRQTKNKQVR